mgnify:CR=1 FL=1
MKLSEVIQGRARIHTTGLPWFPLTITCTITGTVTKGYNTEGGGWSIYDLTGSATPAEFIRYRRRNGRKACYINLNNVVSIEQGWGDPS